MRAEAASWLAGRRRGRAPRGPGRPESGAARLPAGDRRPLPPPGRSTPGARRPDRLRGRRQVAEGRWTEARELATPERRQRRTKVLQPQARLAALLSGREQALACEELALRARLDLDHGREREAAFQVLVALDAAIAELSIDPSAPALGERLDELRELRDPVAVAAQAALEGPLGAEDLDEVYLALGADRGRAPGARRGQCLDPSSTRSWSAAATTAWSRRRCWAELDARSLCSSAATSSAVPRSARIPFPGVDARLSRFSYLVSLFPRALMRELGLRVELRPRPCPPTRPTASDGLLVTADPRSRASRSPAITGDALAHEAGSASTPCSPGWPSAFTPRCSSRCAAAAVCELIDDDEAFEALFEEPLGCVLDRDAPVRPRAWHRPDRRADRHVCLGGRSAPAPEPLLPLPRDRQRDGPLGRARGRDGRDQRAARVARRRGRRAAQDRRGGRLARYRRGARRGVVRRRRVVRRPPRSRGRRSGRARPPSRRRRRRGPSGPEGSQLKINMLLARLPRLRDPGVLARAGVHGHVPRQRGATPSSKRPTSRRLPARFRRPRRASSTATR